METISNMKISHTVLMDRIHIKWEKYKNLDNVRYILVRKKASKPFFNQSDGITIYDGKALECDDLNIKNGSLYYYRLFIFPDPDDTKYISDSKCIFRCIAINANEWTNYGDYIYINIPRDVRFQDSQINLKDPQKNYPLKRFFNLCAYAFNKINVYDDLEIEQIDIENCDEAYLPYHAKWMNCLYDERFGADINRLILKTMEEAEPYMGTMVGLKYILQRIFKADVEISSKESRSCVTNSGALISCNLYTNMQTLSASVISIRLYFDNNNQWLSNMQTTDSIMKIILNYCALRTRFDMVFNVVMVEEYDRSKMVDYYLHDTIYEKINDEYIGIISTDHRTTNGDGLISDTLATTSAKIKDDVYEVLKDNITELETYSGLDFIRHCFANGDGLISDTLVTNNDGRRVIEENADVVSIGDAEVLKSQFCDDKLEVVSYLPYTESYESEIEDYVVDAVSEVSIDNYNGVVEMQVDADHPFNIFESTTNGSSLIANDFKTNANNSNREYNHDFVQSQMADEYGFVPKDDYQQESIVNLESYENEIEDYLLDKRADEFTEISKFMDMGTTNSANAKLARSFLTNVRRSRSETLVEKFMYNSDEMLFGTQYDDLMDSISKQQEAEVVGDYVDDMVTSCIRIRPVSLTCSECVIGKTLFTTDNLYQ